MTDRDQLNEITRMSDEDTGYEGPFLNVNSGKHRDFCKILDRNGRFLQ